MTKEQEVEILEAAGHDLMAALQRATYNDEHENMIRVTEGLAALEYVLAMRRTREVQQ